ncbi:type II secretion system protein, partial [Gemmatimonadota bacterium]
MNGRRSLREALGFTMVEVLTALMVMSVVVRIGIPNYQEILLKAEATRALGDFELIRLAAFEYQADNHVWPPDAAPGVVPPGLETYLPEGYSFH